jgi:hypothetical protein
MFNFGQQTENSMMKTKASKYFTGLMPKRGFARQFRELDAEIRELNMYLTHFIIADVASASCGNVTNTADGVRAEIAMKLESIKQLSLTEDEQYHAECKAEAKLRGISSLGPISDAIKNFRRI